MSKLKVENLSVEFNGNTIFSPVSFEVEKGQVLAITGASGSGKSSLLSSIAGSLEAPLVGLGKIVLDDVQIDSLPIGTRQVGILFQDDLLFPHLTVGENLLYGITEKRTKAERLELAHSALIKADLDSFFNRLPTTLSGGQKARVSLLRTLLSRPKLILLDEPFSKLDKLLRVEFRKFVFNEISKQNIPCLLVTHDEHDIPENAKRLELKSLAET